MILACVTEHSLARTSVEQFTPDTSSHIVFTECWFDLELFGADATCGKLVVPEDYMSVESSKIQLPFIVVMPDALLDPIPLVVAGGGGPGSGLGISPAESETISEFTWTTWRSTSIDSGRPLVLIDNRGVGSSLPNLDCPEVENTLIETLQVEDINAAYKQAVESHIECKVRLEDNGVNVNQYHILNAAKDLNEFRKAYGSEQMYIYGISYGSRVALLLEKLYPSTVRALILDGVFPLEIDSIEDYARLDSDALLRVFDMCESNLYCAERTNDDLRIRFEGFLGRLRKDPITIRITLDDTLETINLVVTPEVIVDSLFLASYDNYSFSMLPLFIESMVGGATDYLAQLVRDNYVSGIRTVQFDEAAYYAYNCFGEVPFNSVEKTLANVSGLPFGEFLNINLYKMEFEVCKLWGGNVAHAEQKESTRLRSPVLMLSGLLDPITPYRYASQLENLGEYVYHLTWKNLGHGVMYESECADLIASKFLEDTYQSPDDICRKQENDEEYQFTFY